MVAVAAAADGGLALTCSSSSSGVAGLAESMVAAVAVADGGRWWPGAHLGVGGHEKGEAAGEVGKREREKGQGRGLGLSRAPPASER